MYFIYCQVDKYKRLTTLDGIYETQPSLEIRTSVTQVRGGGRGTDQSSCPQALPALGHSQFKQHNSNVTKGSESGIRQKLTDTSCLMSAITRPGGHYPCDPTGTRGECLPRWRRRCCHVIKRLPVRLKKAIYPRNSAPPFQLNYAL